MEEKKTSKITTEKHTYEFNLLSAKDGLRLTHQYASMLIVAGSTLKDTVIPIISGIFASADAIMDNKDDTHSVVVEAIKKAVKDKGVDSLVDAVRLIPQVLTWDRLQEFAALALQGAKIDEVELDGDGMCPLFQGDPFEFYKACFWAVAANWPKYIDPLLDAPTQGAEGSDPGR